MHPSLVVHRGRPEGDENWQFFDAAQPLAWKTGTSFGYRDAWAIGTTKDYVVGVWVGNADGEGRPGLVGVQTAAPILFDVFDVKDIIMTDRFDDDRFFRVIQMSGCQHKNPILS